MISNQEIQINNIQQHKFDSWCNNLQEKIPIIDIWQEKQVGENNDGPYRKEYAKIPIEDNGEELFVVLIMVWSVKIIISINTWMT